MNITLVNTFDVAGGAAKAAYRLHRGLQLIGENSTMLVRHKSSADDTVTIASPDTCTHPSEQAILFGTVIQEHYINAHRTQISNTYFSYPYPGIDLVSHPAVRDADIINLHWISLFLSPVSLKRLVQSGKPVFWTLHDQWPFTGGCHYSAGCAKYVLDCHGCPQLAEDNYDLTAAILNDIISNVAGMPITVISPSRWLAQRARESAVFQKARIEVIPNSIETDIFKPMSKAEARTALGIEPEGIVLLCGSVNIGEKRKGFQELVDALRCSSELAGKNKPTLVCYGTAMPKLDDVGMNVISLGYIHDLERLRAAYCSADMFLLPTTEDNLPNTMLESLSCGTPVVAFDTGGIPDVVINDRTGITVPKGDTQALGRAIVALSENPRQRDFLGKNGRALMTEQFTLEKNAQKYTALYQEVFNEFVTKRPSIAVQERLQEREGIDAPAVLGEHMQRIYDQVLYKALQEHALHMNEKSKEHRAHLEAVKELTEALKQADHERDAHTRSIHDLTEALRKATEERAAHVHAIRDLKNALSKANQDVDEAKTIINEMLIVMKRLPVRLVMRLLGIKLPKGIM